MEPDTTSPITVVHTGSQTRVIVGAVIGGVLGFVTLLIVVVLWRRRSRRGSTYPAHEQEESVFVDPLTDPFAAGDIKTIGSMTPQGSPTSLRHNFKFEQNRDSGYSEDGVQLAVQDISLLSMPRHSRSTENSMESQDAPDLSRTFVANVRPTARSPPPCSS
ncbi:hypothetical protein FA15DRAFT_701666 [Coprinopsis marcescibilis]|uniref:Protocadherin domain-containing protein n=1 Tax=Coprinopsis marcescibilis TaxID=230819 RepID=A0A5C3L519_COPMA|nr:hypothetical protein FA15DRAFT_701666 [Coprinopsis marcescibilis]